MIFVDNVAVYGNNAVLTDAGVEHPEGIDTSVTTENAVQIHYDEPIGFAPYLFMRDAGGGLVYTEKGCEVLKVSRGLHIRERFAELAKESVTALGIEWTGGMDSALAIDGAVRIAERSGLTEIVLFDDNNTPHTMSLEDGSAVASAIGIDYQTKFAAKQAAITQLEAIDPNEEGADHAIASVRIRF